MGVGAGCERVGKRLKGWWGEGKGGRGERGRESKKRGKEG